MIKVLKNGTGFKLASVVGLVTAASRLANSLYSIVDAYKGGKKPE